MSQSKQQIELEFPLNDGGQELSTLTLRRPKVRDMLHGANKDSSDADNEVRLFASLCDIPPTLIEEMDLLDYQKLQAAYSGFLS